MKKALLLPLLLCPIAFASCSSGPANIAEVNKLKDLLSKQDLSPMYSKRFASTFFQGYDVFSSHNGEEFETRLYSYRGGGMFGCYYEVDEDAYEEASALEDPDFFDYLSRGIGDYGMMQTATVASYHYDFEDDEKTQSLQGTDFLQLLEARFDEDNVQVYNSLSATETIGGPYESRQYFNGIVDKGILFDAITARAFSDIFARANIYDGQRSCEALDRIYFDTVGELKGKTDGELSDFLTKNDIRFEEGEEATLVHFKVGDEHLRAALDERDVIPGALEGTLSYDKGTGEFTAFDYRAVYVVNELSDDGTNVYSASMEFKADGYSLRQGHVGDLNIHPDPTVYEDAEEFLGDLVEQVIPPVF